MRAIRRNVVRFRRWFILSWSVKFGLSTVLTVLTVAANRARDDLDVRNICLHGS